MGGRVLRAEVFGAAVFLSDGRLAVLGEAPPIVLHDAQVVAVGDGLGLPIKFVELGDGTILHVLLMHGDVVVAFIANIIRELSRAFYNPYPGNKCS